LFFDRIGRLKEFLFLTGLQDFFDDFLVRKAADISGATEGNATNYTKRKFGVANLHECDVSTYLLCFINDTSGNEPINELTTNSQRTHNELTTNSQ
jgi:hypothetical protein